MSRRKKKTRETKVRCWLSCQSWWTYQKNYNMLSLGKKKNEDESDQRVIDIAGKTAGRVPANLCQIF